MTYAEKISAADRTLDPAKPPAGSRPASSAHCTRTSARACRSTDGRFLGVRRAPRRRRRPRTARGPTARRPPDGLRRLRPRPRAPVSDDVELAVRAVRAGAAAAIAERDRAQDGDAADDLGVAVKGSPTDFVSRADTASEAAIVALLRAERPGAHPRRGGRGRRERERAPVGRRRHRRHLQLPVRDPALVRRRRPRGGRRARSPAPSTTRPRTSCSRAAPGRPTTLNGMRTTVRTGRGLESAAVATFLERDVDRDLVLGRLAGAVGVLRAGGAGTLELAWVAAGRVDAWAQPHVAPWDWAPARRSSATREARRWCAPTTSRRGISPARPTSSRRSPRSWPGAERARRQAVVGATRGPSRGSSPSPAGADASAVSTAGRPATTRGSNCVPAQRRELGERLVARTSPRGRRGR